MAGKSTQTQKPFAFVRQCGLNVIFSYRRFSHSLLCVFKQHEDEKEAFKTKIGRTEKKMKERKKEKHKREKQHQKNMNVLFLQESTYYTLLLACNTAFNLLHMPVVVLPRNHSHAAEAVRCRMYAGRSRAKRESENGEQQ